MKRLLLGLFFLAYGATALAATAKDVSYKSGLIPFKRYFTLPKAKAHSLPSW